MQKLDRPWLRELNHDVEERAWKPGSQFVYVASEVCSQCGQDGARIRKGSSFLLSGPQKHLQTRGFPGDTAICHSAVDIFFLSIARRRQRLSTQLG